ncbi:hypothetical protein NP493_1119g00051 [Ridgeia piscesae]|uniref:Adenylate kinase n=1 Tax=Ridgeia piscesae TaxID=27915 RepID=A0AAD9KI65_RIDPI|nr:hypothetical protein NP493_1119g00051 [Ridgeia piscesae]
MDSTKRPLRIPPEFATYAEKHGIFDMHKRLLEQLIIHRPDNPIRFFIQLLKRENDDGEPVPTSAWVDLIEERLKQFDCVKKGWVMSGFPETKEQAVALQAIGIYPKHYILLEAPDTVLIERAAGKRKDPISGEIYHITFDWPSNPDIAERLQLVPGNFEEDVVDRLIVYHRNIDGITEAYKRVMKVINADQPKADVFSEVMSFVSSSPRTFAPHTPRIVLLGPTGSGKAVHAALLASKYNIVNVRCGQLIKQAIADDSKMGGACKAYVMKGLQVPDAILMSILSDRLSQVDCVSRGWVLHGYPRSREQGEQLSFEGFIPNRVFCLDVPNDSVIERLTLRATDPVTGERYHILYNPPPTQEIKERLVVDPRDQQDAVKKRLARYNAYMDELADFYTDSQHINADQDPHTVFECIESMLVKPLPKTEF